MALSDLFVQLGFQVDEASVKKAKQSVADITDGVKTLARQAGYAATAISAAVVATTKSGAELSDQIKYTNIPDLEAFTEKAKTLGGNLSGFISQATDELNKFKVGFNDPRWAQFLQGATNAEDVFNNIRKSLEGLTKSQGIAKLAQLGLDSKDLINTLYDRQGNLISQAQFNNIDVGSTRSAATANTLKDLNNTLNKLFNTVLSKLSDFIVLNKQPISDLVNSLTTAIQNIDLKQVSQDIQDFFNSAKKALNDSGYTFSDIAKALLAIAAFSKIASIFMPIISLATSIVSLGGTLAKIFSPKNMISVFKGVFEYGGRVIVSILKRLPIIGGMIAAVTPSQLSDSTLDKPTKKIETQAEQDKANKIYNSKAYQDALKTIVSMSQGVPSDKTRVTNQKAFDNYMNKIGATTSTNNIEVSVNVNATGAYNKGDVKTEVENGVNDGVTKAMNKVKDQVSIDRSKYVSTVR